LEASHLSVDIEASAKLLAQRGISRELSCQAMAVCDSATFLLVAALMAGVAISGRAFESTASALH
jgi:hypothetical protein